ncbi:TPA: diffuse panbronchiolitis critical region 1-like [Bos taurus]|nr:TPA: diffuse panbronchiolitis critical region 1-like [Bos taurus]
MAAALVLLLGLQAFAGYGPKPQEKGSVPDWAIVLITLSLVAAIVSLLYGIKKACEFRKEMNMGCGCGSVTPYGCHHEPTSQHYSVK